MRAIDRSHPWVVEARWRSVSPQRVAVLACLACAFGALAQSPAAPSYVIPSVEQTARDNERVKILTQELKNSEARLEALARRRAERLAAADVQAANDAEEERGRTLYRPEPRNLPLDMTVHHPATWTRREVFERLGGFDERYPNAMDYDFFLRAHVSGARFGVVMDPLATMAGGGQSERSLWITLRETHAIRRRALPRGFGRSPAHLAWLLARGWLRRLLQRAGLGSVVAWVRRRSALAPKG